MTRRTIAVAIAAILALAATLPCEAGLAVRKRVDPRDVPAWLREAVSRPAASSDAAATILHAEAIFEPLAEGGVRRTSRLVAKILKREALDAYGRFDGIYRKDDLVVALRSWTILPDGTIRVPDPVIDFTKSPFVVSGSVFEDTWFRSVNAAHGSTGVTIAYEFTVIDALDLGAGHFVFGDVDHPTVFSRASLVVPAGWQTGWVPTGDPGSACTSRPDGLVCEARDLGPLPAEDLRPPAFDLIPGVWLRWFNPEGSRGFRDWASVGTWGENLTRPVLSDVGDAAATSGRLRPAGPEGLLQAIGAAFDHASRDVRYVLVHLGIGGYRPHPPALVAKRLFGDCKDKSFLLRAIVEGWGLRSYFLMVNTRDRGAVLTDVPTPAQFNHVIAAIALPDGIGEDLWSTIEIEGLGRLLLLDPTAREGSAWDLRDDVQGTLALVVHPGGGSLVRLPVQPPEAAVVERASRAAVDDQGALLEGSLTESWTGSLAAEVRSTYAAMNEADRRRFLLADLQDDFPGAELGSFRFEALESVREAVRRESSVKGGWFGKRVAGMLIVQPGRPASGILDAALAPPPRRHDVVLGAPFADRFESSVAMPAGWRPEEVPAPFVLDTPELTARATWSMEGGNLVYRREATLLATEVHPDRFAAFRHAVMLLNGADGRAVVFVRTD